MKYWLILLLLASIILTPVFYRPNSNAQAAPPQFVEVQRTEHSKKYQNGNHFIIDSSIAPVHYQDSQGQWQEIDNRVLSGQMLADTYSFRLLQPTFNAGRIVEFSRGNDTIQLQPMTLEWTNNLSQISQIATPQAVTAQVTNQPYQMLPDVTGYTGHVLYQNAYGPGIDAEWITTPGSLVKEITVANSSNLPAPPAFIINGGNPQLRANFIFDTSAGVDVYVDGNLWDRSTTVQTFNVIEFRRAGELLWVFDPLIYTDSDGNYGQSIATLRRTGSSLYIEVRVPYSWLQTAVYPVKIDPTIDVGISVSTDDVMELESTGVLTDQTGSAPYVYVYSGTLASQRNWGGFRFQGIAINQSSTIDVSYISGQVHDAARDYINATIHFQTAGTTTTFNTANNTDVTGRPRTTANTSYVNADLGAPASYQTPSLNAPLQELINSYTVTNLVAIWQPNTDTAQTCRIDAYNYAGGGPAAIHIEFTVGGGGTPAAATLQPPATLTLTEVPDTTINATWSSANGSVSYLLMVSTADYPDSTSSQFAQAFNGSATTIALVGYNYEYVEYYFSLWSYNGTDYSANYTTGMIGGEPVAAAITTLSSQVGGLVSYGAVFLIIGILVLALKLDDFLLYIGAGIIEFLLSSTLIDTYAGIAVVGAILGIALICKAVLQAVQAGGAAKGWSQIKGYYESIKEKF